MIGLGQNESWSIRTSTDELLNFIIFTGCMYDLIDDKNFDEANTPWPVDMSNSNLEDLDKEILKIQWKSWFDSVIESKSKDISYDKMSVFVEDVYNTSDFLELEYKELRQCCKVSYPKFSEWWWMQAGGKTAISFYEMVSGNEFCSYVEELEFKLNKKSNPFNLYIDIVYTGVPNILDVNDEYIIVTPNGYINKNKNWWLNKLIKLI